MNWEENLFHCHPDHEKVMWTGLGSNPIHHNESKGSVTLRLIMKQNVKIKIKFPKAEKGSRGVAVLFL
jgi:hypothetical protein